MARSGARGALAEWAIRRYPQSRTCGPRRQSSVRRGPRRHGVARRDLGRGRRAHPPRIEPQDAGVRGPRPVGPDRRRVVPERLGARRGRAPTSVRARPRPRPTPPGSRRRPRRAAGPSRSRRRTGSGRDGRPSAASAARSPSPPARVPCAPRADASPVSAAARGGRPSRRSPRRRGADRDERVGDLCRAPSVLGQPWLWIVADAEPWLNVCVADPWTGARPTSRCSAVRRMGLADELRARLAADGFGDLRFADGFVSSTRPRARDDRGAGRRGRGTRRRRPSRWPLERRG